MDKVKEWQKSDLLVTDLKVLELEKETTFAFGHFKTIAGHFFANYIFISQNLGADGHFEVLNVSISQAEVF